jgi:hypothetical protein
MKNIILFGAMLLAAAGCAKQEEVAAPAPEVAEAAPTEAAANAPDAYYEYLWCNQGEDFSQEKMTEFNASWNSVIDGMEAPALAAFGYIPKGWETEDYDGLWVLRWGSKEDSAAGWEAYAASEAAQAHDAAYASVLTCGEEVGVDRFGFASYIPQAMPESFTGEPAPYFLNNMFCSLNEGKEPADLRAAVMDGYLPMLAVGAEANPDSSYWFMLGAPDFDVNPEASYDFNWINYWQTAEEGEASSAAFAASEEGQSMMASFNEVMTCEDPQPWDGYLIRSNAAS